MSEEGQTEENQSEPRQDDLISNMKSEFDRKISNQEDSMKKLMEQNEQLAQMLAAQTRPQQAQEPEEVDPYDPQNYARYLTSQITKQQEAQAAKAQEAQAAQRKAYNDMLAKYPELARPDHELSQRANALLESSGWTPAEIRAAVLEAATEVGVLPVSKRKKEKPENDDDFVMSKGSVSGKKGKEEADEDIDMGFAALMGLDTSDENVVKRLKGHAKRRKNTWHSYD